MGQLKRKHHYVWRAYLRPWAKGEQIFTYLKKQNVTKAIGLRDVAHGKLFYALVDLNDNEINFLKTYIEQTSHESVKARKQRFRLRLRRLWSSRPEKWRSIGWEDAYCKTEALGFKSLAASRFPHLARAQ